MSAVQANLKQGEVAYACPAKTIVVVVHDKVEFLAQVGTVLRHGMLPNDRNAAFSTGVLPRGTIGPVRHFLKTWFLAKELLERFAAP